VLAVDEQQASRVLATPLAEFAHCGSELTQRDSGLRACSRTGIHGRREFGQLATCDAQSVTTPTAIELIHPPELTDRAPYAYAAVAHDVSGLVFTAGACPLDEVGAIVAVGDAARQAEQVMANLTVALRAAGAGLADVLKTTVYVASQQREDLLAAWGGL
jgi:enamine deaminase RidA (YjgF/YER057c/UK114 family)